MIKSNLIPLLLASVVCHITGQQVENEPTCVLEQLAQTDLTLMQQGQQLSTSAQQLSVGNLQLNATLYGLTVNNKQLASKLEELETENEQLSARLHELENGNNNLVKSAFSAYMTIGYFEPNNGTGIVVPMNGVNFNLNDDYNADTSTYTCPVSGVYYFSFSVYSAAVKEPVDDRVYAFLTLDGKIQNDAYCQTDTEVNIYCQATNGASLHCNKGSTVQIKSSSKSAKVQIFGKSGYKRTTFTGHIVSADSVQE